VKTTGPACQFLFAGWCGCGSDCVLIHLRKIIVLGQKVAFDRLTMPRGDEIPHPRGIENMSGTRNNRHVFVNCTPATC